MEKIPFDDIAALSARVSEEFGSFGAEVQVTQKMINEFAEITGDHQWIHVDIERCKQESPFGGPVAHGFLTLSLLPAMSAAEASESDFVVVGAGNVVNYGSDKLRFVSPVPADARIASRSRVSAVEAVPKGTRVEREIAVHVVGSERPALVYSMITLYQPPLG